uniref:Putative ovule protein n=1 Tax=Solanum chacoense TaxID=4108 RepID=A0A0V0H795_SOLCH
MEYDSLSRCLGGEMVDTQDSNLMLKSRTETEISRTLTIAREFITILHPENQPHSDHQPLDSMEKKRDGSSPKFFMNKKFIWSQRFGHP